MIGNRLDMIRKIVLLLCAAFISVSVYADQYIVKYTVKSAGSTMHNITTLELKKGTAEEAKAELVRRGTVGKQNADKITIVEIKKK